MKVSIWHTDDLNADLVADWLAENVGDEIYRRTDGNRCWAEGVGWKFHHVFPDNHWDFDIDSETVATLFLLRWT